MLGSAQHLSLCPAHVPAGLVATQVFNDVTFELSKINLQGATTSALGARMGATVWGFDARSGADGPASLSKPWRGDKEYVYYDSLTARRTCLGYLCAAECCYPPIYKVTAPHAHALHHLALHHLASPRLTSPHLASPRLASPRLTSLSQMLSKKSTVVRQLRDQLQAHGIVVDDVDATED